MSEQSSELSEAREMLKDALKKAQKSSEHLEGLQGISHGLDAASGSLTTAVEKINDLLSKQQEAFIVISEAGKALDRFVGTVEKTNPSKFKDDLIAIKKNIADVKNLANSKFKEIKDCQEEKNEEILNELSDIKELLTSKNANSFIGTINKLLPSRNLKMDEGKNEKPKKRKGRRPRKSD